MDLDPASKPPQPGRQPKEQHAKSRPKPEKSTKRPMRETYALPVPLKIHPLPTLVPNNPLSLLHIAYVFLSELLWPPSSHPDTFIEHSNHRELEKTPEIVQRTGRSWWAKSKPHRKYVGYYDIYTHSVHVTDETAIRALWEQGFFGKGSLSRSEPEWIAREAARRRKAESISLFSPVVKSSSSEPPGIVKDSEGPMANEAVANIDDKRTSVNEIVNGHVEAQSEVLHEVSKKLEKDQTSAEVTNKRRQERREEKRQRAKREAEAVEEQLRIEKEEAKAKVRDDAVEIFRTEPEVFLQRSESTDEISDLQQPNGDLPWATELLLTRSNTLSDDNTNSDDKTLSDSRRPSVRFAEEVETIPPDIIERKASMVSETHSGAITPASAIIERTIIPPKTHTPSSSDPLINQEHLQLSRVETFFLVYSLGILTVISSETKTPFSVSALLDLFRRTSYYPPLLSPQESTSSMPTTKQDDPFLLSYVVYHHFRSLGWVVRPGIKFAVDFLLYNRGPVFSHAEFAVLILPSFSHPYWQQDGQRQTVEKKEQKDWWWLHCANRVQTQVRKSLVLVYVDIPPPTRDSLNPYSPGFDEPIDVGALLRSYKVREFVVGRWSMNRNRD